MREGLRLSTLSQRTTGKYESSGAFTRAKRKRGLARGEEEAEVFAVEQEVSKEKEFDYEQFPDSGALVLFQNGEVDAGEKSNEENVDHFLLQNEEAAYAEASEQKGVSNLLIKGPKKRKGRRGRPKKVDQQSGSLILMLQNQEILDRESVEIKGTKKLKRGRGRPKKVGQQNDALNSMVQNEEAVYREGAELKKGVSRGREMLKQGRGRPKKIDHENDALFPEVAETKKDISRRLTKGINMLKPGRGRPKKVDPENDAVSWMLLDEEPAEIKKDVSKGRIKVKGRRGRPRKVNQVNDALNSKIQSVGSAEVVVKKKQLFESHSAWPEKDNKENDGHKLVNQERKDMEGAVIVKPTEEPDQSVDSKRVEFNDCCETLEKVEKNNDDLKMATSSGSNGIEAPSSGLKSKRKRLDKEDVSVSNSKLSGKFPNSRRAASELKNALRTQIVEMLTSAGWRVEHRPRKGREYMDAVYVSPEGRTHWSVTLAYKKFRKQVEKSEASSGSGNTNSLFKPIPEEQLRLLYRIQVEKRGSGEKAKLKTMENSKQKKSTLKSGRKSVVKKVENSIAFPRKRKPSSVQSKTQKKRHCGLQVRRSGQMVNASSDAFLSPSGKHSVLSWMIDSGCVQDDEKVHYCVGTKKLLEGNITRDGICCGCCGKVISIAEFEGHSGSGLYQTYENLFLENGSSLLQCQIDSWNKLDESIQMGFHRVNVDVEDPNDDSCGLCGDGGDLVCCDGCPSTFHQGCLNIEDFPSGEWSCIYCSCKYCGTVRGDVDEEDDGDTQLEQIDGESASSLLTCHLCDEKYHQMCAEEKEVGRVCCKGPTFCGNSCEQVFKRLQNLMGVKAEIGDGFTCTLIKRAHIDANLPSTSKLNVAERISKLAAVQSVMDECFLPIIDHRSGINLIHHTVYSCGSNFKRLNFQGFFSAILEKEDETIAAASIRIHGEKLAEMPFIGTRITYRRQGMCRRLLSGIELALRSLKIEKLIIPAVSEVLDTWTKVFGFRPFGKCRDETRHMNIIQFPFTDILHKPLLNQQFMDVVPESNVTLGSFGSKDPMAEGQSNTVIRMDDDCLSNGHDDSQTRSLHCAPSSPEEEWFDPPETIPSDVYECKAEVTSSEGVHVDEVNVLADIGVDGCLDGDSAPVVLSSNKGNVDVNSTLVLDSVCVVDKCKSEVIYSEGVHVDETNVSIDGCLEEDSARVMLSSNKGIFDVNSTQVDDSVCDVGKCKAKVISSDGVHVDEANISIDGCLEEDSARVMLSSNKGIFDVNCTQVEDYVCDVYKCKAEVILSEGLYNDDAIVNIDGYLEEDSAHVTLASNKGILDVSSTHIEDSVCDVDKCKAEVISSEGVHDDEANVSIDGGLEEDSARVVLSSNKGILDVNATQIEDSLCDVDKCKAEVISCEGFSVEEATVLTDVRIDGCLDGDSAPVMLFSNNGILDVNPTLIEDSFCDVDEMKASSSLLACDRTAYGNYANVGMYKLSKGDSNVNGVDGCEMKNNKLSPGLIASGKIDCEEHSAGSVDLEHGRKVMQSGDTDDVDVTIDCNDRSFLHNINFQPNSNLDCSELDIEVVHPSDSACEGDARSRIPKTKVVNDSDSSFKCYVISDNVVDGVVTGLGSSLEQDLTANCSGVNHNDGLVEKGVGYISADNGQTSTEVAWNDGQFLKGFTAEETVVSSNDDFIPNGAQLDGNTNSEVGEPHKQAESKIMTPSSSCNLSSGSIDISVPGGFHTCGIPEVGSK